MTNSLQQDIVGNLRKKNYRLTLLLAIAISSLLLAISLALPDTGLSSLLKTGLKDIGMSVLIASTVTTVFSEYYRSNREDQSKKELAIYADRVENMIEKQKEFFESPLNKKIEKAGIVDLYPDRKGEAKTTLQEKLQNVEEGTIMLIGSTLRVFFHAGSDFGATVQDIVTKKPKVKFQVLLLNPNSLEAVNRSAAETKKPFFTSDEDYQKRSMQYKEEEMSRLQIEILNNNAEGRHPIEVKFYNTAPYCFLAVFEDECFVSQYIYGDELTQGTTVELPLIVYKLASKSYKRLKWHFEYVWKNSISEEEMIKECEEKPVFKTYWREEIRQLTPPKTITKTNLK